MAFNFRDAFNSQVKIANKLNQTLNKAIGKDVFGEVHEMEAPREFAPYESFADYTQPEPKVWPTLEGNEVSFTLEGNKISFPKELDTCMRYKEYFNKSARYYTDRFEFKYKQCVDDFDAFVHYFPDIYAEGLVPMCKRAYSLLLLCGVYSADFNAFGQSQMSSYHAAIDSYEALAGVEMSKNAAAANAGDTVGNAVQMRGGGFGLKGALKGVAKAEAFNFGMNMVGKYFEQQLKMTKAEKAEIYARFDQALFFDEVFRDYKNTFYTLIQILCDNRILGNLTTEITPEMNTMLSNLKNPMFPKNKMASIFAQLISTNPFCPEVFDMIKSRFGTNEEVSKLCDYFVGP